MKIERVSASHGWLWIKFGFRLIMRSPLLSIVLAVIATCAIFLVMKLPVIGPLLAILLLPAIMAGYMRACLAMEHSEEVELPYLFAGFQQRTSALISLGGFLLMGLVFCSLIISMIGGEALAKMLNEIQNADDPTMLMNALQDAGSGVTLSLMVGFSLVILMMLAVQFAPMLVFFNGLTPLAALKASFHGSVRNLIPFALYSVILQVIGLIASIIPFELGLIVLIPLGLTSMYTSYRDIYSTKDEPIAVVDDAAANDESSAN